MKGIYHFSAIALFILFYNAGYSQTGMWTWIKGSSTMGAGGVYGSLGRADTLNTPPAFYEAANWTDTSGNFWIFGGLDVGFQNYSDLWKFDPVANNWTWVKGPGVANDPGSYGLIGTPLISNRPPARGWGVPTWTDLNGDLWLYGGYGSGGANCDLWRYNIATNTWTWMQGSNAVGISAVMGARGIPAAANTPGQLHECSATWVDKNGNLWLFGGYNRSVVNNLLWKYDMALGQWAWMKGDNTGAAVYGTMGVEDSLNTPGARESYCTWTDKHGNFWLMGGDDYNTSSAFNDMWRFNPLTGNWTWMSGTSNANDAGNYQSFCQPESSEAPTARQENRSRWTDACGNFWLYGGGQGNSFQETYDDLWCFNPDSVKWLLVNGGSASAAIPVYGTPGVPAPGNTPGGRAGSVAWCSNQGDFYVFGGTIDSWLTPYNDLWKYTVDSTCLGNFGCSRSVVSCNLAPPVITADKNIFCANDSAQICAPAGYTSYQWNNSGGNNRCIAGKLAGNYYVTVTDANSCTAESNHIAISIYPALPVHISALGDTLSSFGATSYQWIKDGFPVNNADSTLFIAPASGQYQVQVTDSNGCIAISNPVTVTVAGVNDIPEESVQLYPNPNSTGAWQLIVGTMLMGSKLEIYNVEGRLVHQSAITDLRSELKLNVARGVYFLQISAPSISLTRKLIKL